jgi:hypothetical protein
MLSDPKLFNLSVADSKSAKCESLDRDHGTIRFGCTQASRRGTGIPRAAA